MNFKLKSFKKAIEVTRIAHIHYFEFTKQYRTDNDSHPFCELIYVDDGSILVNAQNYSGELCKNQIIIHKSGEIHSLKCSQDSSPNIIIIGFECKCEALDIFSKAPLELAGEQQKLLSEIIKEGRSVFMPPYDIPNLKDMKKREDYPFGADQMIKIGLESFLIMLVREFSKPSESAEPAHSTSLSNIQAIHQYVCENYNTKITLDNLCFLFGTNKTTLCKSFRQEYGTTVLNYITSLKIHEANIF